MVWEVFSGSTISTLLHDKINPKDCQVLSLGDSGFLQFFRLVSNDDKANPVFEVFSPCLAILQICAFFWDFVQHWLGLARFLPSTVRFDQRSWCGTCLCHVFPKTVTLPETNSLPLKMDGWNTTFLLGFGLFSEAKTC